MSENPGAVLIADLATVLGVKRSIASTAADVAELMATLLNVLVATTM